MNLNDLEFKIEDQVWYMMNVDLGERTEIGIARDLINLAKGYYHFEQKTAVLLYEERKDDFNLTEEERREIEVGIEGFRVKFKKYRKGGLVEY